MTVTQLLLLVLLFVVEAQKLIDQTRGNECRHTCILSRDSTTSNRSTHCTVPIKPRLRHEVSLAKTLDSQSLWILNHTGSINGQLVYFDNTKDNQAVWILSQKGCLDHGEARGFPVSTLFEKLDDEDGGLIGDWDFEPPKGDIFKGCLDNTEPWNELKLKTRADEDGARVQASAKRYMRIHVGEHEGAGTRLEPYEFTYDANQLEDVFKCALREAEKNSKIPEGIIVTNLTKDCQYNLTEAESGIFPLQSKKPLLLRGFPFENGLSLITSQKEVNRSELHPGLVQDIDTLAWNRLQEAVASFAAGPAPKVLLPETIEESDLLYITVLAVTSFLAFVLALRSVENASRERVLTWKPKKETPHWTFVTKPSSHSQLEQYKTPIPRHELFGAVLAFIAALIGIVGAVLTFRNSDLRYRNFMVVRQGVLITYGPSDPATWARNSEIAQANLNAGARFIVGVWLKAQFVPVGMRTVFELIIAGYTFLGLLLLLSWYRFSILRENQLTWSWYRKPMQFFRAVVQAILGGLARIRYVDYVIGSYRSEYKSIAVDLGKRHELDNFTPQVVWNALWDSTLRLIPSPPSRLREDDPNADQIEKAAAFIAADKFGRLSYPQILAYLSNPDLVRAVDTYWRTTAILSKEHVLCLSRLFDIKGVLVPEQSPGGLTRQQFSILGVDNIPLDDVVLSTNKKSAVLLALPEDVADTPNGLPLFAIVPDD